MTEQVFDSVDNGTPPVKLDDNQLPPATVAPEISVLQKRLDDSQAFIGTLKQERASDRQLLDTVTQKLELLLRAQELNSDDHVPPVQPPSISPDELRKQGFVTREDLERDQQALVYKSNLQSVLEIGRQQYGEKLNQHIDTRCKDIGVSIEWAKQQAATNPNVFIELFGLKKQKAAPAGAPTESSVNTSQFQQAAPTGKPAVMYGATTGEMMQAWRSAAATVES